MQHSLRLLARGKRGAKNHPVMADGGKNLKHGPKRPTDHEICRMGIGRNDASLAIPIPGLSRFVENKRFPLRRLPLSILKAGIVNLLLGDAKWGFQG